MADDRDIGEGLALNRVGHRREGQGDDATDRARKIMSDEAFCEEARPESAEPDRAAEAVPQSPSFFVAYSLDDLRGPASGEVTLPDRLMWNPSRPFELADEERRRSLIRIVLREARSQRDLIDFVDRESLIALWPSVGLPDTICQAWECRFAELAERTP